MWCGRKPPGFQKEANQPMRLSSFYLVVTFLIAFSLGTSALLGLYGTAGAQAQNAGSSIDGQVDPGNYCVSCHTPGDARLQEALAWKGTFERASSDPCPAANNLREELYYSERMLLAIDNAMAGLPSNVDMGSAAARLQADRQRYDRLLDSPTYSLAAYTSEAQMLRYRLGKSYSAINATIEQVKRQRVLLGAGLVSVILLISLSWGLYNTRQAGRGQPGRNKFTTYTLRTAALLALLGLFALPIFQAPARDVSSATAEEQERQLVFDTASRSADTAAENQAGVWMLARIGAAWDSSNPVQAHKAVDFSRQAFQTVQMGAGALWGQQLAAHEAGAGVSFAMQQADLINEQLASARSRSWGLNLAAVEWLPIDPEQSAAFLEHALEANPASQGIYRDLDLRSLAVTWSHLDPKQAARIASQITDPALRSWGLREIAEVSGDSRMYEQAAVAARQVAEAVQRARLLREIGNLSTDQAYYLEAYSALEGVKGSQRAYALSDLAADSRNIEWAGEIEAAYPAAQAAALYRLGQWENAWSTAASISDPYERSRAQAHIAAGWENAAAAGQIQVSNLRERALRDIAIARQDFNLAASLPSAYYRVQAYTALGQFQAAWDAANDLKDTYPLVELAVAWSVSDPQAALQVIDAMDREADKAIALRSIALESGDSESFERALGMALAARRRGDPLSPAEASLALARSFSPLDPYKATAAFSQALETAVSISTK